MRTFSYALIHDTANVQSSILTPKNLGQDTSHR